MPAVLALRLWRCASGSVLLSLRSRLGAQAAVGFGDSCGESADLHNTRLGALAIGAMSDDLMQMLRETWDRLTAQGGPFEVSDAVVRGTPMRVFTAAPPSMRLVWEASAAHGDADYLVFEDERLSYAEAHAKARSLAHALRNDHGIGPGDRVAIAMRNYPEWVLAYWATVSVGAAVVGMNAWWTGPEMAYALLDSSPKLIVADDERLERLTAHLDEIRGHAPLHVVSVRSDRALPDDASLWDHVVDADAAPDSLPDADIAPDDDICIFYTSGTTGEPKGAQLTHRGSVHNLLHMAFANTAAAMAAQQAAEAAGVTPQTARETTPAVMVPTPLFHVTANNCVLHPATAVGAKIVLLHRWDPGRALELIEREAVSTFTGVPTMSRELLMHPDWHTRDTSTLAALGGGGAPLQPDLVDKIDRAKGAVQPATGYGLTETHGIVTGTASAFFVAKPTSAGPIMPTFDHKVLDDDGNEVAAGQTGVLWVRGPAVIKGYLNKPEATAEAIVDGYFNTGDVCYVDGDGFVHIVDRAKDMVLRGGENVYCAEVESAIYTHPDVAAAAVFGVPDERLGEKVAAAVHRVPGSDLDEAALREHLDGRIARFKIPEAVWFVAEPLPLNANGKVLKRQLREELLAETAC